MAGPHSASPPARAGLIGNAHTTLFVLLGTVVLVLFICCVNLANLTFARLIRRKREFAVRAVMGANRGRLVLQLLMESSLLALLGGALGIVFARAGMDLLIAFAGRFTLRANEIAIDAPVLGFTLLVSVTTGILIGLVPALSMGRDTGSALREGDDAAIGGRGMKRLRSALIVAELAGTFVLLICFGLMARSFLRLQQVDAGFDSSHVLTVQIKLNRNHYGNPEQFRGFFTSLLEKVEALPGVVSASLGMSLPLDESQDLQDYPVEIEGGSKAAGPTGLRAEFQLVSAKFFDTLGLPLLSGRTFADSDHADGPEFAIVSRSVARQYWGDSDPVGKWIAVGPTKNRITIAGVVGDVRHKGLDSDFTEIIYLPYFQLSQLRTNLLVRTTKDPGLLVRPVTETV